MTDVFFANDTSCVPNWGSQATSESFRSLLTDAGAEISHTKYARGFYGYEPNPYLPSWAYLPTVASKVADAVRELDYVTMHGCLKQMDDAVPEVYSQFDDYARAAVSGGAFTEEIAAIKSSDVTVINVEGYGHGAGRATRAHFFLAYLAREYLDTPCVMANVTLDPLADYLVEMAEEVLPILDDVVFREPLSAQKHSHLCSDYRVGADPVFAADVDLNRDLLIGSHERGQLDVRPYATNDFDPSQPYIAVGGNSIFVSERHHLAEGYGRIRADPHVEGYLELCRRLKQACPQVVLVVSSVNDEEVFTAVAEQLDVYTVGLNASIRDSISLVANADVYVGGRYHPTLFAALGATPIVPIAAVSHKIDGVMEMLELDTPVFDPFDLTTSADEMAGLAERYRRDASDFDHLDERCAELADAAARNVQFVRSIGAASEERDAPSSVA